MSPLRMGLLVVTSVSIGCATADAAPPERANVGAGRMQVELDGRAVTMTLAPSAALFTRFDDDGDGRIDAAERRAHRRAIVAHLTAGLTVENGRGQPARSRRITVAPSAEDGALVARMVLAFEAPPAKVVIGYRHGRVAPVVARVVRDAPGTTGTLEEQARFDHRFTRYTFFSP